MVNIRRLHAESSDFEAKLRNLTESAAGVDATLQRQVRNIVEAVRNTGDQAVLAYTRQFDRREVANFKDLCIPAGEQRLATNRLQPSVRDALRYAHKRIRAFHERQIQTSWDYEDEVGNRLGQRITALDRVGIYAPGGKAAYASSVLMGAVPAKVAGVGEIILSVPAPDGVVNDFVLAAAHIAGVDQVFTMGGAQAIAAMAYGTQSLPAVDKIVGPGNAYVTSAKRMVFGRVGIDMIAGPSEILVVSDGKTDVQWITMDLFSQAEHDEEARAILISPNRAFLDEVHRDISARFATMERGDIIRTALEGRGALIEVRDLDQAIDLVNRIAPEHLELAVAEPEVLLPRIRHAGAVFMGSYTSEVLGDYCAGPNHILPTSGTARFSSPLGVYDFQKRTSVIQCSREGVRELGTTASILAREESLTAHARSAELRLGDD